MNLVDIYDSPGGISTRDRIEMLEKSTLLAGWDNDGAMPISPHVWARVDLFYQEAKKYVPDASEPFVWPSGAGSVFMTWVNGHRKVIAEFLTDTIEMHLRLVADSPLIPLAPEWQTALHVLAIVHDVANISDVEELTTV